MNNDVYTFRLVADYVQRVANIDIGKELLGIDLKVRRYIFTLE